MPDLTAKRTLVKSPPELWSELSEVERLARHLDAFGEIKITRLETERTVAWEGEAASGTVLIEPSGWGTKVTLTARVAAAPAPPPVEEPEAAVGREPSEPPEQCAEPPEERSEPPAGRRRRFFAWFFGTRTPAAREGSEADGAGEPPSVDPPPEEPAPAVETHVPAGDGVPPAQAAPGIEPDRVQKVLDETLEALGSAHHRPFSRG